MNDDSGVLVGVNPALGSESVGLVWGVSRVNIAVLEDNGSVAEDEINGAINITLAVELSLGVDVESVLVSFKATFVEN